MSSCKYPTLLDEILSQTEDWTSAIYGATHTLEGHLQYYILLLWTRLLFPRANWIHIHMQFQNVEVKVGNSKEYFPTWPHPCSSKFQSPRTAIPCANCDLPSSLSALSLKVQHLSLANSSGHCVPPPVAVWKSKLGMWCSSRKGKKNLPWV